MSDWAKLGRQGKERAGGCVAGETRRVDLAVVTLTKLHFSEGGQLNREMRKRACKQEEQPPTNKPETMLDGRDVKCSKTREVHHRYLEEEVSRRRTDHLVCTSQHTHLECFQCLRIE